MSFRSRSEHEIALTPTLFHRNGRGGWLLVCYPRPLCGRGKGEGPKTRQSAQRSFLGSFRLSIAFLVLVTAGCDPIVNIGGTFFPGWMVAILIGSALTVAVRYLFVITRLEPHLGPLALIYTSLGLLLSVVSWLILYRS
jgi:hypothetical protein